MPLHIQEYVDIKKFSSFSMGSTVRWFAEIRNPQDIEEAVLEASMRGSPLCVLGKGCNTIFSDTEKCLPVFVLYMNSKGIEKVQEDDSSVIYTVKSGEDWDSFVQYSVDNNLSGIEALSHIPSSVGATPVQNVGAYGQEVSQAIQSVHVYDLKNNIWCDIENSDCLFDYRTSIFKGSQKSRYIIESVTLRLRKQNTYIPSHKELAERFKGSNPTPRDIRNAVIEIREKKLPDPRVIPNCGSFFENVIVEKEIADRLLGLYPSIPLYPEKDGKIKISSGWMIDKCGLKGFTYKNISVSDKNALVLIHNGKGTISELEELENLIIQKVKSLFGVVLEREPNIIY